MRSLSTAPCQRLVGCRYLSGAQTSTRVTFCGCRACLVTARVPCSHLGREMLSSASPAPGWRLVRMRYHLCSFSALLVCCASLFVRSRFLFGDLAQGCLSGPRRERMGACSDGATEEQRSLGQRHRIRQLLNVYTCQYCQCTETSIALCGRAECAQSLKGSNFVRIHGKPYSCTLGCCSSSFPSSTLPPHLLLLAFPRFSLPCDA